MHTPDRAPLPKSMELLWDHTGTGSRGPKRGLSLDQIVQAAITVADAEGYAALSMARVAKELGFTTMSLYRYVDSKDTLVDLLLDRAIGEPPAIPREAGWRTGLEAWAWAEHRAIRAHPWWLDIPMNSPPLGPNNMAWLEAGMSTLAAVPVAEPLKLQLLLNLSLSVIGRTRFLRDMVSRSHEIDYQEMLLRVVDPTRYPAVHSAISHRAFDSDDIDWDEADFAFFLDRLLDGYEVFIGGTAGA
ncbi:TetR/AcrR family transcriptional regulator [Nocardia huaxiensis]|uniref:TetR/AcrR family transcriptional regulator C-terminal domain-containing protein n=1 Tax=Nocardia huaxiensis TaxID=2755382 RepID=A0A7D6ZS02_9NOCA|nr:TetR/AcrR family transcriptional regulator [Nocardia huaxiensis]QLY33903.1 TetR/AcrR family transcriptional regulator C-terminal domain-containing protein [Nocardia huaxiensis]UFS99164.1 TetR/AcrR family transcriptional regulator [Nocardia huaxiensis]